MPTNATGTPTSPDNIARIAQADNPSAASLTTGINAIPDTAQTALNTYFKLTPKHALVYATVSTSFGSSDGTVNFGAVAYDTGSFWSSGAQPRITIPTTGYYEIETLVKLVGGTFAGAYQLSLRKNGTTSVLANSTGLTHDLAYSDGSPMIAVISLTAADYLEVFWSHGTSSGIQALNAVIGTISPGSPTETNGYVAIKLLGT